MRFIGVVLLLLLAWVAGAYAGGHSKLLLRDKGAEIYLGTEAPRYLYRWTTLHSLQQFSTFVQADGSIAQFPANKPGANVFYNWPNLRGSSGGVLFSWTDPLGATQGGPGEAYGNVLTKFEIDVKRARTVTVVEYEFGLGVQPMFDPYEFQNVDIVIRKGAISEIIILNPAVIVNYTSDPEVLRAELESKVRSFRQFGLNGSDMHVSERARALSQFNSDVAVETVQSFLSMDRNLIPSNLKNPMPYVVNHPVSIEHTRLDSYVMSHWIVSTLGRYLAEFKLNDLLAEYGALLANPEKYNYEKIFSNIPYEQLRSLRASMIHEPYKKSFMHGQFAMQLLRYVAHYADSRDPEVAVFLNDLRKQSKVGDWLRQGNRHIDTFHDFHFNKIRDPFADDDKSARSCRSLLFAH